MESISVLFPEVFQWLPLKCLADLLWIWGRLTVAKRFYGNLAWWVDLSRDYNIWADKNNPPPIWGGTVLMPRDFGAFFKHLFNFADEDHRLRAKLLFNQRINLWKRAIKNKKLLI